MSLSNPGNELPNPAARWFEWSGGKDGGYVKWYDKDAKTNVSEGLPFTFICLDELAAVKGWHDPSQSGIYSNQIRDSRTERLTVKAFKGGVLGEGLYKEIKERVNAQGGDYHAILYVAVKLDGALRICGMQLKGAALGAWMEWRKAHKVDLYKKAVQVTGFLEDKKGSVTFRVPTFAAIEVSDDTRSAAIGLDVELQAYLKVYFSRRTVAETDAPAESAEVDGDDERHTEGMGADDEIPF
jgi:hypothetical protein